MSERKFVGWFLLIPRLLVLTSASISLYHAYSIGSIWGIIAGILLTAVWALDAIYLTVIIIHDFIKKDDSWSENLEEELHEAVEGEKELFNTHGKK